MSACAHPRRAHAQERENHLSMHIISDVEAVANRLLIVQHGRVLADTTPEALVAKTEGSVWSVTIDQVTALQLQASYQVSTMVNQIGASPCALSAPRARTRLPWKFPLAWKISIS